MLGTGRPILLLEPGAAAREVAPARQAASAVYPVISCIMASRGRLFPALLAIACYRRQSYAPRELVIVTAARDGLLREAVARLADPSIRLIESAADANVGALRNIAIAASTGDLLSVWDDDDLSHADRLSLQYRSMRDADAMGCFLARVILWWPGREMLAVSCPRVWENTMLVERADFPPYPGSHARGEDTMVAEALRGSHRLILYDVPEAYCYVAHGENLWHADHFEMLFRGASRSFVGSAYGRMIDVLSADLPLADYAAGLVLPN